MTAISGILSDWFKRHWPNQPQTEHPQEGAEEQGDRPEEDEQSGTTTGGGSTQEPVVVWEAANRMEAQIVAGRLQSEEIPTVIGGEALGQIYGLTTGNLARANVLVPGPLADKARRILETEVDWDGEADAETPPEAASNQTDVAGGSAHESHPAEDPKHPNEWRASDRDD